jgi:hypothetical protein
VLSTAIDAMTVCSFAFERFVLPKKRQAETDSFVQEEFPWK